MPATLVIREGRGAGSEHPLDGETILGRESRSADVVIDDPGVSRRHAAVTADGPALTLRDLGSSNGTLLNGRPVRGAVDLADGDEIEVGSTILAVNLRRLGPPLGGPRPSPAPARKQPAGLNRRLDEEGNVPALAAVFLGPLSIFLLLFSTGAAFFVSLPCAIGAIVLGTIGVRRVDRGESDDHRTLARIGRISGIVGTVLSLLALAVFLIVAIALDVAADNLSDLIDRAREELEGTGVDGVPAD